MVIAVNMHILQRAVHPIYRLMSFFERDMCVYMWCVFCQRFVTVLVYHIPVFLRHCNVFTSSINLFWHLVVILLDTCFFLYIERHTGESTRSVSPSFSLLPLIQGSQHLREPEEWVSSVPRTRPQHWCSYSVGTKAPPGRQTAWIMHGMDAVDWG